MAQTDVQMSTKIILKIAVGIGRLTVWPRVVLYSKFNAYTACVDSDLKLGRKMSIRMKGLGKTE
jgi:hypothetical protein